MATAVFPKDHVGGDYAVVLVARDRETRMTVSHVVPVKGGDQEWVAEQLTRDILKLGLHGDLTLRSDQEPAIVDLLKTSGQAERCWKNLLGAITSGRLQSERRSRESCTICGEDGTCSQVGIREQDWRKIASQTSFVRLVS